MTMKIIAEIGVNHNGSPELARRLVEAAAAAGADAVKLQTFRASLLATPDAPKATYQKRQQAGGGDSQLSMLSRLELSAETHEQLARQCAKLGVELLATPFDEQSAAWLAERRIVTRFKVASGDITHAPLLLALARRRKPLLLSTGMCTLSDIEQALGVLAYGFTATDAVRPRREAFYQAYQSAAGQAALAQYVTLLHATTAYPAPAESINLRALDTLAAAFGLPVGLSDHSEGFIVPVAAAARGAVLLEKHLTLSRSMEGPDHRASLDPEGFAQMVQAVRQAEAALGTGRKLPNEAEADNARVVRRSLVAARDIEAGQQITKEDLAVKRPGGGLTPYAYWELLGQPANRRYRKEERLE